jgi:hypothetical protein
VAFVGVFLRTRFALMCDCYTGKRSSLPSVPKVDVEGSPFESHVKKPATKLKSSKCRSPVMGTPAETRKTADERIKEAAAAVKRAEQTAETSRELLLELKWLRRVP